MGPELACRKQKSEIHSRTDGWSEVGGRGGAAAETSGRMSGDDDVVFRFCLPSVTAFFLVLVYFRGGNEADTAHQAPESFSSHGI